MSKWFRKNIALVFLGLTATFSYHVEAFQDDSSVVEDDVSIVFLGEYKVAHITEIKFSGSLDGKKFSLSFGRSSQEEVLKFKHAGRTLRLKSLIGIIPGKIDYNSIDVLETADGLSLRVSFRFGDYRTECKQSINGENRAAAIYVLSTNNVYRASRFFYNENCQIVERVLDDALHNK